MTVISTNKHTVKMYYSSQSQIAKEALGYIEDAENVLTIDVTKTNVTGTVWKTIADNLGYPVSNLVTRDHPTFKKLYDADTDLDENGWIKVLNNHPEVLVNPVVIVGENYHLIETPSKIPSLLKGKS